MDNSKVVVSRKWADKTLLIEAFATDDEVGARMDLGNFVSALVKEVGYMVPADHAIPMDELASILDSASKRVLKEMKVQTKHVV
jgi:hypothetical protein